MKITAEFVTSAARASDLPADGLPAVAFVGRSNVGKSSLINALVRTRVARTSGTPGKTRLANVYRVARGPAAAIYVIDLPGYGYSRGGNAGFNELALTVFGLDRQEGQEESDHPASPAPPAQMTALLLVDARHPGLENDRHAWAWLRRTTPRAAVVATKIDKLARGERIRAMGQLESVCEDSVLPVSAVTGEGLDELWKLIDKLVNSPRRSSPRAGAERRRQPPTRPLPETAATARRRKR